VPKKDKSKTAAKPKAGDKKETKATDKTKKVTKGKSAAAKKLTKGAAAAAAAKLRKEKKADTANAKGEKKGTKGLKVGTKRDAVRKALKSKIRVCYY